MNAERGSCGGGGGGGDMLLVCANPGVEHASAVVCMLSEAGAALPRRSYDPAVAREVFEALLPISARGVRELIAQLTRHHSRKVFVLPHRLSY